MYLSGKKIDKKNKIKVSSTMRNIDLKAEIEYENLKVCNPHIRKNQNKYYYAIEPEFEKLEKELLKIVQNKIVLEIGCSTGILAEKFSLDAKKYLGIDISNRAIKIAKSKKLTNAVFCVADVHALNLPNESIDVVLTSGVLHHLDLKQVCKEINRVLRPRGILVAREPLGINPIFNWYRNRTPEARTHDEKPLKKQELEFLNNIFLLRTKKYLGFTSLLSVFCKNKKIRSFFYCLI